ARTGRRGGHRGVRPGAARRAGPLTDPYRTLELQPGASQADIKRAYRRLAKVYHPDSAGPTALPRFLAIQQAYEQLATSRARTVRGRGSAPRSAPPPAEPWRADPDRAQRAREAAREAARERAERARRTPG